MRVFQDPASGTYWREDGRPGYACPQCGNGYATAEAAQPDAHACEGEDRAPTVANVKRHAGIAGQFSVSADVTYPGEPPSRVTFTGSTYGGPVVAQFGDLPQQFVTDPERFGSFAEDPTAWVRRFFA